MECYRHGGTDSTATCVGCQRPICAACTEEVAGHPMCQSCVAEAQARLAPQPAPWLAQGSAPATGQAATLVPAGELTLPTGTATTAATEVQLGDSPPVAAGTAP